MCQRKVKERSANVVVRAAGYREPDGALRRR